ncbi:hypothetical protein [Burkholderia cenocepacia]|uniref:hypothetical protein n=1 Tax=Burkholderia cenocepacia TaxID=95486 RepID=UPI00076C1C01|nr:hypothetical protein [Burkholderia cenocepacia]KWU26311.1 hypothetical protein AS149_25305 [Burkholderia cenocepacia]
MTRLAAKVFRMVLVEHLEAPYGGNLAAGASAEVLAREFREGVPALLTLLAREASGSTDGDYPTSLSRLLMEVWTARDDDGHLKNATGKTRKEWLDAPLWSVTVSASCAG